MSLRQLLLAWACVLVLAPAAAWAHAVRFCANYTVDYGDYADFADQNTDDDYLTATHPVARGAHLEVVDLYTLATLYDTYTDDDGTYVGCTTSLTLLGAPHSYRVRVYSDAQLGTNIAHVGDPSAPETSLYYYTRPTYVATGDATDSFDTGSSTVWDVVAAAGEALYRNDGGLTGETLFLVHDPTGSSNWFHDSGPYVGQSWVRDVDWKAITAHELGHQVMWRANGGSWVDYDDSDDKACALESASTGGFPLTPLSDCNDPFHTVDTSKEFQSCAVMEGWATFYAAAAFNDLSGSDCWFGTHINMDWDADTDKRNDWSSVASNHDIQAGGISCSSGPDGTVNGPSDGADFVGDHCLGTGITENTATRYDYVRFFWDLTHGQGLTVQDTLDIVLDSWQHGGWTQMEGTSHGDGYPKHELLEAADNLGFLTEWQTVDATNGVDR